MPPAGNGRVLITSQSQHWPLGQAIYVPVLDEAAAAGFLVSRTGDPDSRSAGELAEELGGLPLALEQAGAYIQATGMKLADYLDLFRQCQAELLARGEATAHPHTVTATLTLALARLERDSPIAGELLRLLSCLAPEPIPLDLLLDKPPSQAVPAPGGSGAAAAAVVKALQGDQIAVRDAIAALRRYSLISPANDGTAVILHRLVQAIAQDQIPDDQVTSLRHAAADLVARCIPADTAIPAAWLSCAMLHPHVWAVLDLLGGDARRIARYLDCSGNHLAALHLLLHLADAPIWSDTYGPRHPETLAFQADLASMTGKAGNAPRARELFAALLPVRQEVSGAEHPDTLAVRAELAYWTGAAGDAAGARDQFAALLPVRQEVSGAEHPDTLAVRAGLAYWTGAAGDAAGARDLCAALLPVREKVLGAEHPDTLAVRAGLANWTGAAGDAAAARDIYAALLPVREKVLGAEHRDTLAVHAGLAYWTGEAGNPIAARELIAALLPIVERVNGTESLATLAYSRRARLLGRGGGGRGGRPGHIRGAAAGPGEGSRGRGPGHPPHPGRAGLLDRGGGGRGGRPGHKRGAVAGPGEGSRGRGPRTPLPSAPT